MIVISVMMDTICKIQQIFAQYIVLLENIIVQEYKFNNVMNVMQVVINVRIPQLHVHLVFLIHQIDFYMIINVYLNVLMDIKIIQIHLYVIYVVWIHIVIKVHVFRNAHNIGLKILI